MLTVQQERHKNGEKHLSKTDADTYCNHVLKSEFLFLKEVDKFALTNAIYHLDNGYNRFLSIIHPEMKDLSIRTMKCDCGCSIDRDYNAAFNIKSEGLRQSAS